MNDPSNYIAPEDYVAPADGDPKASVGSSKLPLHLVPPSVLVALAGAFSEGAAKYGSSSWRHGAMASVYYAAALRHLVAWWAGEDIDPDSGVGKTHLAGALACLAILVDAEANGVLEDDRVGCHASADDIRTWRS